MALALDALLTARKQMSLRFTIFNQIHDAFLFLIPEDELDETCDMIKDKMSVPIPLPNPLPNGERYLKLRIDIDVYDRWCE